MGRHGEQDDRKGTDPARQVASPRRSDGCFAARSTTQTMKAVINSVSERECPLA